MTQQQYTEQMDQIFKDIEDAVATMRRLSPQSTVPEVAKVVAMAPDPESITGSPEMMKAALSATRVHIRAAVLNLADAYDKNPLKDDHAVTKELGDTKAYLGQLDTYFTALIDGL